MTHLIVPCLVKNYTDISVKYNFKITAKIDKNGNTKVKDCSSFQKLPMRIRICNTFEIKARVAGGYKYLCVLG